MKLVVLGATGPLGRLVVERALERGHDVVAFARDPSRIEPRPRLEVAKGDVLADPVSLDGPLPGRDAVVSALGVGKSLRGGDLIARAARNVVDALRRHGIRRLAWVSAFGVGATHRDAPFVSRLFFRTLLANVYADKRIGDGIVAGSGLDWTIVAPTMLTHGPSTGKARHGERLRLSGMPSVSRADVAEFIVGEIETPRYVGKTVLVSD